MPWYYAGPDSKPVGPLSFEELQGQRASGLVRPETYVIEHTGQAGASMTWRRYRELFPEPIMAAASLPPVPASVIRPPLLPPPAPAPVPSPLFPSAAAAPVRTVPPPYVPANVPQAAPHAHYPVRVTNPACAWGFGLAIAGFLLAFACGVGVVLDVPALILCVVGLVQVQRRPGQSGTGLAICGGVLAFIGLLVSIGFLSYASSVAYKEYHTSAKEQDSE